MTVDNRFNALMQLGLRTPYDEAVLALAPLRFYRNISGGVLVDLGSDGVDGTLQGGLAQDGYPLTRGVASLKHDAAEYVTFSAGDTPTITGDLTLSCVYKLAAADMPSTNINAMMINHHFDAETEASNNTYNLRIRNDGGTLIYRYYHESGAGVDDTVDFTSEVIADEATHLVLTRDVSTNTIALFVNGVKETGTYTNDPTGGSTAQLALGARIDGGSHFTNGLLSEIVIDDKKASDADAQDLYRVWNAARADFKYPIVEGFSVSEINIAGTSIAIDLSSVVDRELLILAVGKDGTASSFTDISGWTALTGTVDTGTAASMRLYSKVASSEPATVTQSWGGADDQKAHAIMVRISGAGSVLGQATTTGTSVSPQSPDVANSPALALLFYIADANRVALEDDNYPAGSTGQANREGDGDGVSIGAASLQVPVGSIGAQDWTNTLSLSEEWVGATVLIDAA